MLFLLLSCCSEPYSPLWEEGALLYQQIPLHGLGQSALVLGPDGTCVFIDVGNDRHANNLVETLRQEINIDFCDYVLLTHYHSDHIGGLDDLADEITISNLITRGPFHLEGANIDEYQEVIDLKLPTIELCNTNDCPLYSNISLGEDSELGFIAVGSDSSDSEHDFENGHSIIAYVRHGDFKLVFAGDLTVSAEKEIVNSIIPPSGIDILILNHHGKDSNSIDWLEWIDSESGTVNSIVANSPSYFNTPNSNVVDRVVKVLDGNIYSLAKGIGTRAKETEICDGPISIKTFYEDHKYQIITNDLVLELDTR